VTHRARGLSTNRFRCALRAFTDSNFPDANPPFAWSTGIPLESHFGGQPEISAALVSLQAVERAPVTSLAEYESQSSFRPRWGHDLKGTRRYQNFYYGYSDERHRAEHRSLDSVDMFLALAAFATASRLTSVARQTTIDSHRSKDSSSSNRLNIEGLGLASHRCLFGLTNLFRLKTTGAEHFLDFATLVGLQV
jgi:hypothetical protein